MRLTESPIRESNGDFEEEEENEHLHDLLSNGINLDSSGPMSNNENKSVRFVDSENQVFNNNSIKRRNNDEKSNENESGSVFKSANWLSDSELIFSLTNQVGGLVRALRIFQELDIGIKHVESRKSRRRESEFEIFVDIDCSDAEKMKKLVHHLR